MQKNELQFWEELYVAAVLETDPAKVAARIDQAQGALRERWRICVRRHVRVIVRVRMWKTRCGH